MRRSLFVILSSTIWQIIFSLTLFFSALAYKFIFDSNFETQIDIKSTTLALGTIGSILALATSVSFAFMIFSFNQASSRKHDLFYKFKSALFEFDRFLKDCPKPQKVVSEAESLSWELKFLKITDFPLRNWDYWIKDLVPHLENDPDSPEDPNLNNSILGYLGFIEEVIGEIGMICINQIISQKYIEIVTKIFVLIGLLLMVLILNYIDLGMIPRVIARYFVSFVLDKDRFSGGENCCRGCNSRSLSVLK